MALYVSVIFLCWLRIDLLLIWSSKNNKMISSHFLSLPIVSFALSILEMSSLLLQRSQSFVCFFFPLTKSSSFFDNKNPLCKVVVTRALLVSFFALRYSENWCPLSLPISPFLPSSSFRSYSFLTPVRLRDPPLSRLVTVSSSLSSSQLIHRWLPICSSNSVDEWDSAMRSPLKPPNIHESPLILNHSNEEAFSLISSLISLDGIVLSVRFSSHDRCSP